MVRNLPYNHAFSFALLAALAWGCGDGGDEGKSSESNSKTLENTGDSGSNAHCQALTPGKLDLLFVIDNSGSMAQEQARLQEQIPPLLAMLSSGQGRDGTTFEPIHDLHVGVTTTDMGLSGSKIELPPSCGGMRGIAFGSLGKTGFGDDGILLANLPNPGQGLGRWLSSDEQGVTLTGSASAPAVDLPKLFDVGVRGCGFEQHLDAMYKALAPSTVAFPSNGQGHGDNVNAGFLRDDATLAVVIVSDEDDCSVTNEGLAPLFDDSSNEPRITASITSTTFFTDDAGVSTPIGTSTTQQRLGLNIRCFYRQSPHERVSQVEQAGFVAPPSRYFSDFVQSVKPNNPESVAFIAMVGIPDGTEGLSAEAILAHPGMDFATDPTTGSGDPSQRNTAARDACRRCASKSPEECMNETLTLPDGAANPEILTGAKPALRLVQVAQGFGENGLVRSICSESYAPAIDGVVQKIARLQAIAAEPQPNCTP